jgi:hypothetical protein
MFTLPLPLLTPLVCIYGLENLLVECSPGFGFGAGLADDCGAIVKVTTMTIKPIKNKLAEMLL